MSSSAEEPTATPSTSEGRFRRDKESFSELVHRLKFTRTTAAIGFVTLLLLAVVAIWFTDLPAYLAKTHLHGWWLVAAVAVAPGIYLGFAVALKGASSQSIPVATTFELEVAESVTTVVTPESIGSLALTLRFLTKQGLSTPDATAAAGLSTFMTTAVAGIFVPIGAIFAASSLNISQLKADVPSSLWVVIAIAILAAIGVTVAVKVPKFRHSVEAWGRSIELYLKTVATEPVRGAIIAGGELITAAAQVATMSFVLLAVGAPLHLAAILVICQLAGAASNVVPVPGGLGAPEAIIVTGLSSVGIGHVDAIVAAVLYRLLTYWLPPLFGMGSLYALHRRQLV